MLDFEINLVDNGIGLCPTCHITSGDIGNPGWTFFQSDLEFFIEFEQRERERRSGSLLPDSFQPRPITGNTRLTKAEAFSEPLQDLLSQERHRPWHGAPMAALRRGIAALGSLYIDKIPDDIVGRLVELRRLYMSDEAEGLSGQRSASGRRPPRGGVAAGKRGRKTRSPPIIYQVPRPAQPRIRILEQKEADELVASVQDDPFE